MKTCFFRPGRRGRAPNRLYACASAMLPLAFCLILSLKATPADQLIFHSPSFEEPFYRIQFPLVVSADRFLIKDLELNGAKAGPFLVFSHGKNVSLPAPLEAGTYTFVLDYAWSEAKPYRIRLACQPEKSNRLETLEFAGTSPKEGGIPGGKEGFYRIFQVEEEAGIERNQEVIALILVVPKADLDPLEIVIFDGPEKAASFTKKMPML
jgi:hypothetical protein